MKQKLLRYVTPLGVVSFLTGFALMAYELVAARLLAPTLGGSIYVWTSVIGTIIAALSLGYWIGGKLADARQRPIDIVALCLAAAIGTVLTLVTYDSTLQWIAAAVEDVRLQGVIASLLLFVPTSFLLGCTSPYLAKLNIKTLKTAGESVASLSALNSIGGIAGTFVTGFVLFSYIGSNETLIIVVICLLASSWLLVPKQYFMHRIVACIVLLAISFVPKVMPESLITRIDTPSANYSIHEFEYKGQEIYGLTTGPGGVQSAVYADGREDLVFWYTNFTSKLIEAEKPQDILILGGGTFTLPRSLAESLPNATIDAVEIDPALKGIAEKYFHYDTPSNVNLQFSDARAFVNSSEEKYDVIFVDVFGDSVTPFSVLTKEYVEQVDRILNPGGIVIINAIIGFEGACGVLFDAVDAAYRSFFSYAYWATESGTSVARGNYILVYGKQAPASKNSLTRLTEPQKTKPYTDNFMPAEKLHYQCKESV